MSNQHPHARSHGYGTAQANPTRSNLQKPGRFGLLFPELAMVPWTTGDATKDRSVLHDLGKAMHVAERKDGTIPAGMTYFGQFVDHDMTFDPTPFGERAVDVDSLVNFRTPALDLDSVYGRGPRDQPYLYLRDSGTKSEQMLVGPVVKVPPQAPGGADAQVQALDAATYDLPRIADGLPQRTAVLGDKRNDENLIVAQFHRTMLHFHNAVCLEFPDLPFTDIRKIVTHHYQQIVLHEFLPAVAGPKAVKEALKELRYFLIGPGSIASSPFMPLEFSGAAYRFGHSMVRPAYNFNKVFNFAAGPGLSDFRLAFTFTGDGGFLGGTRYPTNWLLDWRQFFDDLGANPQKAFAIDAALTDRLRIGDRDDSPFLAELNLLRGAMQYKLPSGQAVAARMGLAPLTPKQLESGTAGDVVKQHGLGLHSPLWFYILKEAEVVEKGKHLGPMGGTIVAEVIVGLIKDDPESVLNAGTPRDLPRAGSHFTIADLFKFVEGKKGQGNIPAAGVINPLG
ncbi:MAG: heme peroxidase family protein [Hydrogenophaga sp.]|jgi:hypothetical protein|nr:heme peroxidase family protein [Hydrogenophaga sp.]